MTEEEIQKRRKRAFAFALAGVSWDVIADDCGYASRSDAIEDIESALLENPIDDLSAVATRHLQVARLSRLLASVWGGAINGNNRSVEVSASLIRQICKMQGIDGEDAKNAIPEDAVIQSAYDELAARRPGTVNGPRREGNGRRRGRRVTS